MVGKIFKVASNFILILNHVYIMFCANRWKMERFYKAHIIPFSLIYIEKEINLNMHRKVIKIRGYGGYLLNRKWSKHTLKYKKYTNQEIKSYFIMFLVRVDVLFPLWDVNYYFLSQELFNIMLQSK